MKTNKSSFIDDEKVTGLLVEGEDFNNFLRRYFYLVTDRALVRTDADLVLRRIWSIKRKKIKKSDILSDDSGSYILHKGNKYYQRNICDLAFRFYQTKLICKNKKMNL